MKGTNMKKLMIAAAAVAFGMAAFAADVPWFNGGVAEGWPTAGTGLTGGQWDGVGTMAWSESKQGVEVTAATNAPLTFSATTQKTLGNEEGQVASVTIQSTIEFTPFSIDEMPTVPEGAKTGAILVKDGESLAYYILGNEGEDTPNVWTLAEGVEVVEGPVAVSITMTPGVATYFFGSDENATEVQCNTGDATVSQACYAGDGLVKSLSATYEGDAPATVTMTIYAENATVNGISAGLVEIGTQQSFTVTPEQGYQIVSVKANEEELTPSVDEEYSFVVPEDDFTVEVTTMLIPVIQSYTVTFSTNAVEVTEKTLTDINEGTALEADQVPEFTGGSWDVDPVGAVITCNTNFNYTISAPAQDLPSWIDPADTTNATLYRNWATEQGVTNPVDAKQDAFLLNCANNDEAIEAAKAGFKIQSITVAADGTVTVVGPDQTLYNGSVIMKGATTLDGPWTTEAVTEKTAKFFKAYLELIPAN